VSRLVGSEMCIRDRKWIIVNDGYYVPSACGIPMVNLHIHSKDLRRWMSNRQIFLSGEISQDICKTFLGTSESFSYNPKLRQDSRWVDIDHVKDEINNSKVVYIEGHNLYRMYDLIKFMKNDFVLVSHNSDENIDVRFIELLENKKIIRFYAQNLILNHSKAYWLPIGFANSMWPHGNAQLIESSINNNKEPKNGIYFNFSIGTNREAREACFHTLMNKGLEWNSSYDFKTYLSCLKNYKYAICPVGNGIDTHRLWETVYLNVVPIVKSNPLIEKLKPYCRMIILSNWDDLNVEKMIVNEPELNFNDYLNTHMGFLKSF
jgi:hypothetical protein